MKEINFLRFGGLSLVKQRKRKTQEDSFYHKAPTSKGVYAFPQYSFDTYLLPYRLYEDRAIKICNVNDYRYDEVLSLVKKHGFKHVKKSRLFLDETTQCWCYRNNPKVFKYSKNIWHHLVEHVTDTDIIDRFGYWILTSYSVYVKAYNSEINRMKNDYIRTSEKTSKDHLEVFIAEKI